MNRLLVYSIAFLLLCSCNDWLDINENPDSPATVDYEEVLPSGISSIAYVMGGKYQILGALWSQHWTQSPGASQYQGIDSYDISSSSFDDNQFGELYAGALKALEYVKVESEKNEEWNYYLIANVMQAYIFQVLADIYDEIPFSEALVGDQGSLYPHYEKGHDIYDSLVARIDSALAKDFDKEDLRDPGQKDILFGGDMDLWIEFANTLKLKLFLRQSETRPEIARTGIVKLFEGEVDFLSVDAAMVSFQDESGRRNPLYETEIIFYGNNPNLILSYTLFKFLEDNNDYDRLNNMFYLPGEGGGAHKALVQGNYNDPDEPPGTSSSSYSKPIFLPNYPVYLMSFSESCFLQAEAMMRYDVGTYTRAKEKYEAAVTSAYLRVLSINPSFGLDRIYSTAESFYSDVYKFPSEGSPTETFIKSIIIQKWVSLAGIQSLETFFEQSRTHYPEVSDVLPNKEIDDDGYTGGEYTLSVNNVTSGRFPKRLIFPESEISGNPYTPVIKPVWEKIWWDKKP